MLRRHDASVTEERNSRKSPLDDDGARALLAQAETVYVARGKKRRELPAAEAKTDDLKGPTGNYRAPMIRVGEVLLVGFHPDTLEELVAG